MNRPHMSVQRQLAGVHLKKSTIHIHKGDFPATVSIHAVSRRRTAIVIVNRVFF
jgi:hypothetical protein